MDNTEASNQLFSFDSWEDICDDVYQYYDCTLKVPMGNHAVGEFINVIVIDLNNSTIELFPQNDESSEKYSLIMSVGNRIMETPNV